jgi:hypothetical protein
MKRLAVLLVEVPEAQPEQLVDSFAKGSTVDLRWWYGQPECLVDGIKVEARTSEQSWFCMAQ